MLAADVFYQRDLAAMALRFLRAARAGGRRRARRRPGPRLRPRARRSPRWPTYDVPVLTVLEDAPVKRVTVYRLRVG